MRKVLTLPGLALGGLMMMAAVNGTPEGEKKAPEALPWNVDAPHTEVNFSVKHFFTPVTGTFRDYEIDLMFDPEALENSSVRVSIAVGSVDTNNEKRDNHLRSPDFFDAESYPNMIFQSTSIRQVGPDQFVAKGTLTIKETTREIELPITLLGVKDIPGEMQEMLGGVNQIASFQAETTLDRREFEVGVANWAQTIIVGGDVKVSIALEANRK